MIQKNIVDRILENWVKNEAAYIENKKLVEEAANLVKARSQELLTEDEKLYCMRYPYYNKINLVDLSDYVRAKDIIWTWRIGDYSISPSTFFQDRVSVGDVPYFNINDLKKALTIIAKRVNNNNRIIYDKLMAIVPVLTDKRITLTDLKKYYKEFYDYSKQED
jgi:hypothetical protein